MTNVFKDKKASVFVEGNMIRIDYKSMKSTRKEFRVLMYSSNSDISCGVKQLRGIPTNSNINALIDVTGIEEAYRILVRAMSSYKRYCRFMLVSDNDAGSKSRMHDFFDFICDSKTNWGTNPNSGSQIRVWVIDKAEVTQAGINRLFKADEAERVLTSTSS